MKKKFTQLPGTSLIRFEARAKPKAILQCARRWAYSSVAPKSESESESEVKAIRDFSSR